MHVRVVFVRACARACFGRYERWVEWVPGVVRLGVSGVLCLGIVSSLRAWRLCSLGGAVAGLGFRV